MYGTLVCNLTLSLLFLTTFQPSKCADRTRRATTLLNWGDKCDGSPQGGGVIKDCDISRGYFCQKYEQGFYCGCPIRSSGYISYDKKSKECRLKPLASCNYDNEKVIEMKLPFNQLCHMDAVCGNSTFDAPPDGASIVGNSQNSKGDVRLLCRCKPGFMPDDALNECRPISKPGSSPVITPSPLFLLHASLVVIFWKFYQSSASSACVLSS